MLSGDVDGVTYIKSHDGSNITWQPMDAVKHPRMVTELIEIEYDGKIVKCTPDHKIWTVNRGWVEAQNLEEDDELVSD